MTAHQPLGLLVCLSCPSPCHTHTHRRQERAGAGKKTGRSRAKLCSHPSPTPCIGRLLPWTKPYCFPLPLSHAHAYSTNHHFFFSPFLTYPSKNLPCHQYSQIIYSTRSTQTQHRTDNQSCPHPTTPSYQLIRLIIPWGQK